jgi:serine/threonine protein kinase
MASVERASGRPPPRAVARAWDELCETASYRSGAADPAPPGDRGRAPGDVAATARVVGLDPFIRSLVEFELMARDELDSLLGRFPADPGPRGAEHLARELVRARRLTEYQAGALLQGKARGLVIGGYLILDRLGRGGMGLVFKARHRRMKRLVALKILPPSYSDDASAVLRFRREAEAVARLGHPNIVAALDAGEFRGLHFFVMEYVEGSDLAALVKGEGPMAVDRALDCLEQAARGLKAAHERGIYHRDIKPSNLMLDAGRTLKILDLGLARMEKEADFLGAAGPDEDLTRPGALMGTVAFMSPEQAYNAQDADHRSDIYSLGCTLYFLLTGDPPYSGVTRMACLLAHRERPIPDLRRSRPDVPPRLDDALRRMLAKAPEARYQAIDELIAEVDAIRNPPADHEPVPPGPRVLPGLLKTAAVGLVVGGSLAFLASRHASSTRERPEPHFATKAAPPVAGPTNRPLVGDGPAPKAPALPPVEPVGEIGAFRGHGPGRLQSVAVTTVAGGRSFALSAGNDRTVRYWDVGSGEESRYFAHDGFVFAAAFEPPDSRRALSAGSDRVLRLWDLKTGAAVDRFVGHEKSVYSLAFSPDGRRVLSGGADHSVRLWDVATFGELAHFSHDGPVTAVAYSPVSPRALSAGEDRTVRLWDLWEDRFALVRRFDGPARVLCLAISADGHTALSGADDGAVTYWDLDAKEEIRRFEGPVDDVRSVAFLGTGGLALSGTRGGKLTLRDLRQGRSPRVFEGPTGHLAIAPMADGRHALTADDDGVVRVWNLIEATAPGADPSRVKAPPASGP